MNSLDALLALPQRKRLARGREMATEAFELARKNCMASAAPLLAAPILAGVISAIGEVPLDELGTIVYSTLKSDPDALSTKAAYAFLLAGSQPAEAVSVLSSLLDPGAPLLPARALSCVHAMRAWIRATAIKAAADPADTTAQVLADYTRAVDLDPANLHARHLRARWLLRTDPPAATRDLEAFVDAVGPGAPGLAVGCFELVEALFRCGPKRLGCPVKQLLERMEAVFERGLAAAAQAEEQGALEVEIEEARGAREGAEKMVEKVRVLAFRAG
ncbi:hypothetical protein BDK51DRAFT_49200 [Blyttiomyces helicus]|uniref:Uncharacterized protein n=1 Tax=Blyttiomyces helicus TaxID=388810 RepID=A0A4P9WRE5_9FUNG|nr:hypothetical protein BDK51DRAFT_49200 [Blyttiomyces helicus]|eukprot:RKO93830.1 hypothetical protein BDK51DRAFT_49200 [Blyttiomyces helicus]